MYHGGDIEDIPATQIEDANVRFVHFIAISFAFFFRSSHWRQTLSFGYTNAIHRDANRCLFPLNASEAGFRTGASFSRVMEPF